MQVIACTEEAQPGRNAERTYPVNITLTTTPDGNKAAVLTQTGARGATNVTTWGIRLGALHFFRGYGGDMNKVTKEERAAIRAALLA